jgi:competence protein ComEC
MSALLGALLFFEGIWWVGAAWLIFHLTLSWRHFLLHSAALILFSLYSCLLFSTLPEPGAGRALISIHSVQRHRSPFATGWLYKGTLRAFESSTGRYTSNLPCSICYPGDGTARPKADCDYLLEGVLCSQDLYTLSFKPKTWERIEKSYSLAELRIRTKERIRTLLQRNISDRRAADFLTALFSGEIDDRALCYEFGRLGLQHILAISGFHFALLAAFAAAVLRQILPYRPRLWALFALALVYFLFIGNSPSVQRSFFAVALFLSGALLRRRSSGLNLLGACLLFEIALDPLAVRQIGFQFSFLSCGAILLLNAPISHYLARLIPKRSYREALALSTSSQASYVCTSFFTRALSLTLAVNIALCPLLLLHFHRFGYLSILYNLFTPPLAALCLLLILPGLLLHTIFPLLALPFFKAAGFLAGELIELVGNPPALLNGGLSADFPGWLLAPYLGSLFFSGIYLQGKLRDFQTFPR